MHWLAFLAAVVQFVAHLVFAYQLPNRDNIQHRFNISVSTGLHYLQKSKSKEMLLRIALLEIVFFVAQFGTEVAFGIALVVSLGNC